MFALVCLISCFFLSSTEPPEVACTDTDSSPLQNALKEAESQKGRSERISTLLEKIQLLDEVKQRKIAAVVGAAVADAAARPLHWVYDNKALQTYIEHVKETPEFLPESKSPFYSLPTGENSCYWDIAEASLTAIAKSEKGAYDYDNICKELEKSFGPENTNGYDATVFAEFAKKWKAKNIDAPHEGKYFHGAVIDFLRAYESDEDKKPYGDSKMRSTEGFCLLLPISLKFAGDPNFDMISNEVIQTMTTWKTATQLAMTASRIVNHLIESPSYDILSMKHEISESHPKASRSIHEIQDAISNMWDHSRSVIQEFGPACNNPSSFQGAIHATVTSTSYTEAVRKTIRAGGCNCSRAFFIGAMCGAKYGIDGIPREWIEKTTHSEKILSLAIQAFS